MLLKQLTVMDA